MNQDGQLEESGFPRGRLAEREAAKIRLSDMEEALRNAVESFRFIYENASFGYQILDEEARIFEVNPAWLSALGYSRKEVIGRLVGDFLTTHGQDKFRDTLSRLKSTGEIRGIELDMLGKDGSAIPVILDGHITKDQSGRFKQIHFILHGLTESMRSKQELEESQERLSLALDGTKIGIWDWDLTKGRAYWTERTFSILGYEANEVEPTLKNWKKLVHPDDWPGVSENFNLHIKGEIPLFLAEYRTRNKAGQWQWTQTRGKVFRAGEDEKPVRMAGVVVDITDRKRAEERLRLVNRVLKMVSECHQALVRASDEATLLTGFCRILVERGAYRVAWIGFADKDDPGSLRPVAKAGIEKDHLDTINMTWADAECGHTPADTAIRSGQPVICRNIAVESLIGPLSEAQKLGGCISLVALPLRHGGGVLGALVVFGEEACTFDEEHMKLLGELADDLAYGINALRVRSELEQAESAGRKANQMLINIIEFLPDATFVVDQDKRIIAWNRACETMTGVKKQALIGLGDYAYAEPFFGERRPILIDLLDLPSSETERAYKYIHRKGDQIYAESFIQRLHDGQGAHLWCVAEPLYDPEGQRCGAIEVIRDVTEQKCAEEELRHSGERYRTLVEESFDGIFVQRGTKIVFASSRLYEMLGYGKGELEGLDHWIVYHPAYHEITKERAQARMRGEEAPSHYEVKLQRKDGSSFEGEIRAKAICLDGEAGVQVWVRDISERKEAEKRLSDSERKYRELVELANSIILRWNSNGQVTFLNEFGQKFFGYSEEEILGRQVVDTIVPQAESGGRDLGRLMAQITANPKAFERNINENIRRNGERVWIEWANRIITDDKGKVAEVLSIGTDVTERRTAQEALRQAHIELEHRVAERTVELAQAKKRAETADHLKSAFLATMSHELRTPLNSIIGFTGIILQGLAGPLNLEQTKQLEMVRSSSRHLLALINDVLDISKIEAGQLQVASERFDVRECITKVLGIVAPLAEKKELNLRSQIAAELAEMVGDQRRFEQILLNLLNNAVKFTDRGEVALTAELVSDFKLSDRVLGEAAIRLSVSDTGIGIRADDLATLFEPFRQIDMGLARSHEGTGLGLAICRRLADLMGGEIRAESVWNKGSVFSVTLPLECRSPS